MLDKVWLTSVLPLINDREQSVVQLASKLILVSFSIQIYLSTPLNLNSLSKLLKFYNFTFHLNL